MCTLDEFCVEDPITVAVHDAFVVKYDASTSSVSSDDDADGGKGKGQRYLPLHCDQSSHSFTIALNSADDYEGGGTYFPTLGAVLRPGKVKLF